MPPTRAPARQLRAGANKPPAGRRPPTDGKPPGGGGSRFSGGFGRFRGGPRAAGGRRGGSIGELLRDTRQELKKVEWPSREEATKLTAAVVGLSAVVGIFLGGVDFLFQEFFKILIGLSGGA